MKGRSQSGFQQNRIWLNDGSGHFNDVSKYVADNESLDSRSIAMADLWNRGVLDIIVANQNNSLLVLKNNVNIKNHWIAFELEGTHSNKSAVGATVELFWDSKSQLQVISGGIGFSSQNQRRLQFGLGESSKIDKAVITWPDGKHQVVQNPEADHMIKIREPE